METKHKELYESPWTEVLEVKTEGVICQSGKRSPYDDGGDDLWLL